MARHRENAVRRRIFVALPSKLLEAASQTVIVGEYKALIAALKSAGFEVVCPLEQVGWNNKKPSDPHLTIERRLRDLEESDYVLVLPRVRHHTSSGVMAYTFWALAKNKPTTAYMRGDREAYDLDVPWQLIGLRDAQAYGLKIVTYAHNLSDGFDDLLDALQSGPRNDAENITLDGVEECPFGAKYEKYWRMRHDLFSRWDEGIHVDAYGLCSVKPERIAREIASRLPGDVVLDACCGEEESRTIQLVWHVLGSRLLFMTAFLNITPPRNTEPPTVTQ